MNGRRSIDVGDLPPVAFGRREPQWLGVVLLVAIEGMMFVLLAAMYLYIRSHYQTWPPTDPGDTARALATAGVVVLLASVVPMLLSNRAARGARRRGVQRCLAITIVIGVVFVALRGAELATLAFDWDDHAHGSVVWATLFVHTLHAVSGTLENGMFLALFLRGPIEKKHYPDVDLNGLYWLFVVAAAVPFYALFYLESLVSR